MKQLSFKPFTNAELDVVRSENEEIWASYWDVHTRRDEERGRWLATVHQQAEEIRILREAYVSKVQWLKRNMPGGWREGGLYKRCLTGLGWSQEINVDLPEVP